MIDFEFEPAVRAQLKTYHAVAEHMMRPISREYDEREHEKPWQFYEAMWSAGQSLGTASAPAKDSAAEKGDDAQKLRNLYLCLSTESCAGAMRDCFSRYPIRGSAALRWLPPARPSKRSVSSSVSARASPSGVRWR
jgi:hypothetical protein